jgi:predicted alpha-1,2-mannosidase
MTELHTIASDLQDVESLGVSLYDLFTPDEMSMIYRWNSEKMWLQNGTGAASRGIPAQCAARLWQNIVEEADRALAAGMPRATLRFGHDTALYRLLSLLGAQLPMTEWGTGELYKIVPMAANLQMVFGENEEKDVIVGLYLNEEPLRLSLPAALTTKTGQPWYRWTAMKQAFAHFVETQKWQDRTRNINTMVGTDYAVTRSLSHYGEGTEEHGQTLPAVQEPHGQTTWTPQTQDTEVKCVAPYYYKDTTFQGFRASHWLVGGCTQDYGSFTLMPMMGRLRLKPGERATPFAHDGEISHPYYYMVELPREHLMAEMTARSHAAIFRFTAEEDGEMHIVVNPNSDERQGFVAVDTVHNRVWGYNPVHRIYQGWGESAGFSGWFAVEFQQPISRYGVKDTVAYVSFRVRKGDVILAKAASSFCDLKGALTNMQEIPGWDFLGTRLALGSIWQRHLATIDVESNDEKLVGQFYGALYRSSFLPRTLSDADGRRPRFASNDKLPQEAHLLTGDRQRTAYTDYSMWDIYRAQLPLLSIIEPRRVADMMQSLANMYREGGWMPIFPCWNSYTAAMIGDHGASVVADAAVKGNAGFDLKLAYEGLRKNAFESPSTYEEYRNGMGRRALKSYLRYGYIPMEDSVKEAFHVNEQVSRTLEYAYDDFCLAQLARVLGKSADYEVLMDRSQNWRKVFNPRTGWIDGRYKNGRWVSRRLDLTSRRLFITEGAVAHYSFYVPHDVYGLMQMMGGREGFADKLDRLFALKGSLFDGKEGGVAYWHGNEPCQQIAYMYAWAGQPWKTQRVVHDVMRAEYLDAPGGLSGNDDAGQTSAWYVLSALGFYPVCPATPYYILGTPAFQRARIGKLTIEAPAVSGRNIYIQRATWNGRPYDKSYITHDMIEQGGTLHFDMDATPNPSWASSAASLPPDVMR